ncbi:cupin domain-containing protein [Methanosarcina sp. KYL-1]|uniref:cupin domain-containing protein n=1 Tax=Methanosarcina sp. KYL-1 TaxID=2602068 RepID=UPI0021016957|nr:cupin domain-containing protein [Methanosarcina sp. KYL-1]
MPLKTEYEKVEPYTTKDGSIIRELMHPSVHGNSNQSLAEATVPPGGVTILHKHAVAEEIYHITEGSGIMTLGNEEFEVRVGDTVCIPPGTPHRIRNTGEKELKILCCCAPGYAHEDTELME